MKNTIASTATTPKFQVSKETTTVIKNIVLEGVKTLRAVKITTTYEVTRELHPKTNKPLKVIDKNPITEIVEDISYNLITVTPKELAEYRRRGISSFVLKVDGNKLYYTSIPDNICFVSSTILGVHQCAVAGHECNRLSAASDEQGGCAKVRNRSQYIERYPWITCGYESFNTRHDSFVVVNCLHYEKCPPRKKLSAEEINRAKLSLAQFVWDDVTSRTEVRERVARNNIKKFEI